ncbi:crossover junction endodeoxyribonuclease RuvC [Desulfoferrobacter suflitae]|uniref:crossover junction endodeoxyribonuclease RuvC n=1 Tax=Desulfoferrobacter suflitae TaxID=2865782 RepID=UPI002164D10A|nr:crossover junction endodeoxyribonuclease RuvC [Desulfoferrobacter suflitae]MCK8601371.1 crossover junction endodeoxyribonuclease RuvC [Desulfoferrobacter suflitae]
MFRVIGIDPGSRFTGYGVVESSGNQLQHISNGTVCMPARLSFPERLKMIYEELTTVIRDCRPQCMAIEDVFFAKNVKSALKLGQARGAAIMAGVNSGLPIYEYSALQIKQAVVGYGRASKDQVVQMIQYLFRLHGPLNANAADALAAAICHLNTCASRKRWVNSRQK